MRNLSDKEHQQNTLNKPGCFRSELLRVCPHLLKDSFRRNHGAYVKSGQLIEGKDFVKIRELPEKKRLYDPVFYFESAINIFKERWDEQSHWKYLKLQTLSEYGFEIIDEEVVKRKQLSLLDFLKLKTASEKLINKNTQTESTDSDRHQFQEPILSKDSDSEFSQSSQLNEILQSYKTEILDEFKRIIECNRIQLKNLLVREIYRQEQLRLKDKFLSSLSQKIKESNISAYVWKPIWCWSKLDSSLSKSISNSFPIVYIIIRNRKKHFEDNWDVFYVGKSSKCNTKRFVRGHEGISALEKKGYSYEIYYFESHYFCSHGLLQQVEIGLQSTLEPYWELLTPKQRGLIKKGQLFSEKSYQCFPSRDEIIIAS
jgi:hypothetical protein